MSSLLNFHDPSELRQKRKEKDARVKNTPDSGQGIASNSLDELKAMKVWICWNFVEKGGRRTKVPISASGTATGTNEKYRHTWVTFDEAKAAATQRLFSGVGFAIPKGWFFLDIDHRDMEDDFVKIMLSRFDSYAEKSVSGEGLHIYGKCDFSLIPTERTDDGKLRLNPRYYLKNPHNGMELYMGGLTNRYAVFTENVVADKPLHDCTDAILQTLEKDMKKPVTDPPKKAVPEQGSEPASREDLRDVIASLRRQKNGEKFIRLFDKGDLSGYGSQSEADLALCSMLAFRVGNDPELIDRLFRLSALYRKKWERADYRNATIQKALANIPAERGPDGKGSTDVLDARKETARAQPRYLTVNGRGNLSVNPALLAAHIRENLRYLLVRDNARQGQLKYVYEDGVYRLYDDNMFKGVIKRFIEPYGEALVKIRDINETYQLLLTEVGSLPQEALNADESIINFKNGLLHISADGVKLGAHSPDVLSTIQIPCDWTDEKEDTPTFDKYLDTLTNGDRATKLLLMEFIGACLSNIKGWRMKKSLFLVGDGDTGKSQLKGLVERLLGKENFIGIDLGEIEKRFGTGAIYGRRLAGSSDMSFLTVSELKTFKKITGGDSLFAEFKGQQAFEFTYNGMLWFCMNRLPKFGGDDGKWVYDRIMVVNCPNVIEKDQQDRTLLDKMYRERRGIIQKAVKALQIVLSNSYRFDEPESVAKARQQYMDGNNTVVTFFEECMQPWVNGKIQKACTTGRIYKVYQAWCRENNNGYSKTAKEFREGLADYLGSRFDELTTRQKGYTYYKAYGLTLEAKELYRAAYGYDADEEFLT